jgi:hypothetical protein
MCKKWTTRNFRNDTSTIYEEEEEEDRDIGSPRKISYSQNYKIRYIQQKAMMTVNSNVIYKN